MPRPDGPAANVPHHPNRCRPGVLNRENRARSKFQVLRPGSTARRRGSADSSWKCKRAASSRCSPSSSTHVDKNALGGVLSSFLLRRRALRILRPLGPPLLDFVRLVRGRIQLDQPIHGFGEPRADDCGIGRPDCRVEMSGPLGPIAGSGRRASPSPAGRPIFGVLGPEPGSVLTGGEPNQSCENIRCTFHVGARPARHVDLCCELRARSIQRDGTGLAWRIGGAATFRLHRTSRGLCVGSPRAVVLPQAKVLPVPPKWALPGI